MEGLLDRLIPEMRRGVLQMAILSLLGEKSYGYALCRLLGDKGFPTEEGTLYPILRRFEEQGLIQSSWKTDGPRPRKYYQTTKRGAQLLKDLESEWVDIAGSVQKLLAQNGRK